MFEYWKLMPIIVLWISGFLYAIFELHRVTIKGEKFIRRAVIVGVTVSIFLLLITGGTLFLKDELSRTVSLGSFISTLIIVGYITLIFILIRYGIWNRYRKFVTTVASMPLLYRFVIVTLITLAITLTISYIAWQIYVKPLINHFHF